MPNPFPGMDPYLEGDLWTSVHTDLCVEIARQLSPKIRPKYVALSTRRVILAFSNGDHERHPDIGVLSKGSAPSTVPESTSALSAPLTLKANLPEAIPHASVEIRDVAHRRLVTCIEVLSPTNKKGTGLEDYASKRLQILSGGANLVEIDLLRGGARFPTAGSLPPAPYFVFTSHVDRLSMVDVWPIALEQPLPSVPIPLLPDDEPVALDLQQALAVSYDAIGYDELVDYSEFPPGLLAPEQAAWIDERLRATGRRTT